MRKILRRGLVQSRVTLRGARPEPVGPAGSLAGRVAAARGAGAPRSDGDPAPQNLERCAKKWQKAL
jgi:hypothetical protein